MELVLSQAMGAAVLAARLELRDEFANAPLHYAARHGHLPVIQLLGDPPPLALRPLRRLGGCSGVGRGRECGG